MARLPQPGSDAGQWGQILNDYLSQVHNTDGTLKDSVIAESNLAAPVATKLNAVAGPSGATGPQGTAGTSGATGATGPEGATGPAGQDGTSVTITGHVATAASLPSLTAGDAGQGYLTDDDGHLHVWSGSAWTDVGLVRGPSGATGPQGTAGTNGATGATGPQGTAGTSGATGATGPQGTAGTNGATGATGPQGATGPAGSNTYTFVTASTNVTASSGQYIFANAASNAITITLPAAAANAYFSVKKIDGGGNAITVSGGIIDGATSATIYSQQWASQDFLSDGTQWYQV